MPRFGFHVENPVRCATEASRVPTDAAGHVFDPSRYRSNPDGSPMVTQVGTFRLKPGKKHAPAVQ